MSTPFLYFYHVFNNEFQIDEFDPKYSCTWRKIHKKSKDDSNTVLNFSSLKLSIISLSSIELSIFTMTSVCNTGSCSLIQELINTVTLHHIIKHY